MGLVLSFCDGCTSPVPGNKPLASKSAARIVTRQLNFGHVDPDEWHYEEDVFGGAYSYAKAPEWEAAGEVKKAIARMKAAPEMYEGIMYQTSMTGWPADQQKCKLLKRTGADFRPQGVGSGGFSYVQCKYVKLEPDVQVEDPDQYTDSTLAVYSRQRLGNPLMPGRGQGLADVPDLCIISEVDPSDVLQGGVGDCWLLSAISGLAEFDGAIAKLYAKCDYKNLPADEFNHYTITLYDMTTFEPVDIVVDERLCCMPNGKLLGNAPSITGELWVCYLEKAVAALSGGWDNIKGGTPSRAWMMLTGCRECYSISPASDGRGWGCYGTKNANTGEWEELSNNPHAGFRGLWPMDWPEVGGGGDRKERLENDELFQRMVAWHEQNYVIGAGTRPGSDHDSTQGIVDGHAYTVMTCMADVAGSGINLVKVRNPWGRGEFKSGMWDDDGPGWDEHPDVKSFLKPVTADNGVFWLSDEEFFQYYKTVYLCAKDMAEFIK